MPALRYSQSPGQLLFFSICAACICEEIKKTANQEAVLHRLICECVAPWDWLRHCKCEMHPLYVRLSMQQCVTAACPLANCHANPSSSMCFCPNATAQAWIA